MSFLAAFLLLIIIVMLQRLWQGGCRLAVRFLYPGIEEA
jgi:hypothetical protein